MTLRLLAILHLCLAGSHAAAGCGPDSQSACTVEDGQYHLALPPDATPDAPAVIFLHGWGSNGGNVIANRKLITAFGARGYALLAPSGSRMVGTGAGRGWNFFPGWEGRDETAFLTRMVADAQTRFGIDANRVLLAGFSGGAFMVNYLACARPETFSAYAPVAGGFWRPHPETCAGPVRLLHTHGWTDSTVPLEGRYLGSGQFQQGDVFAGLEIWRAANLCQDEKPSSYSQTRSFLRRAWSNCAAGSALELALFPDGHKIPEGWADMALDWFEHHTAP